MEPISIRELRQQASESPVDASLRVQLGQASLKETRQGKAYRELVFADSLDSLTVRVWSEQPMFVRTQDLQATQFFLISGKWVDKGSFGIEPLSWDFRPLDEEEQGQLLGGPPAFQEKLARDYSYIVETVQRMHDPRLRKVSELFLASYEERLLRTAAARTYHHARRGGLVEHVAQMLRSAEALLGVYPDINADLVLAGVLFHDCGKLWENAYQKHGFVMPHQEVAELLSHIPLGIELVNKLWRDMLEDEEVVLGWDTLVPRTDDVRRHLLHLIASHHGSLEFGSPVLPKTPEAMLLHFVDNIDAKLEMFKEGYARSALVGKNVYERHRPLPHALVQPLEKYVGGLADQLAEGALAEDSQPSDEEVAVADENHGASDVGESATSGSEV